MNGIAENHLEDKRRSGGAGGDERLETLLCGACDRVAHRPRSLVIISTHQKAARRPGGGWGGWGECGHLSLSPAGALLTHHR